MKVIHVTIIVIAALTAQARSVDVTLWRGKVNVDAIELPPNEAALFEVR